MYNPCSPHRENSYYAGEWSLYLHFNPIQHQLSIYTLDKIYKYNIQYNYSIAHP